MKAQIFEYFLPQKMTDFNAQFSALRKKTACFENINKSESFARNMLHHFDRVLHFFCIKVLQAKQRSQWNGHLETAYLDLFRALINSFKSLDGMPDVSLESRIAQKHLNFMKAEALPLHLKFIAAVEQQEESDPMAVLKIYLLEKSLLAYEFSASPDLNEF